MPLTQGPFSIYHDNKEKKQEGTGSAPGAAHVRSRRGRARFAAAADRRRLLHVLLALMHVLNVVACVVVQMAGCHTHMLEPPAEKIVGPPGDTFDKNHTTIGAIGTFDKNLTTTGAIGTFGSQVGIPSHRVTTTTTTQHSRPLAHPDPRHHPRCLRSCTCVPLCSCIR